MISGDTVRTGRRADQALRRVTLALVGLLSLPSTAGASLLSPELEDKLATGIALFVIFVVPVVLIVLFWMVHILPEKIAHKRNHPQFEAIRTLCLLSLVFGGLLWPIAWLWAYSKPVMYKMAYGTDKGDHGHEGDAWDQNEPTPAGPLGLSAREASSLGLADRLARLEQRGVSSAELGALRADLDAIEARVKAGEGR